MSERVIHGFSPDRVFYFFEQISQIPRESGNEAGVADYLVNFAKAKLPFCEGFSFLLLHKRQFVRVKVFWNS